MKLNLPQETIDSIAEDLKTQGKAHFKYDDRDFYVRWDHINFPPSLSLWDKIMNVEELTNAVTNNILANLGAHFNFTTVARNHAKEICETGKMISVYFCVNSKYDTTFPAELIDPSECHVRTKINTKK